MDVNPYLTFDGKCEEALKAYQKFLGGEIVAIWHADRPVRHALDDQLREARLTFQFRPAATIQAKVSPPTCL